MHVNTIPCCLKKKWKKERKKKLLPQDLPASSPTSHPKEGFVVEKPTDLGSFEVQASKGD